MNAREFLIDYFEIETERYNQEGDVSIAEMFYDHICNGDIDDLIDVMEKYAEEHANSTGRRMEE